ncbi:SUPPRESSOR OF AUXIN RESISTANCE1 [Striga hermonthica]|uniref:SUPPRESSOR OF AUXIN RESISTANCE1 n=1 Tax=Striga hermonthica TaxID=68872 RepID=A0A9N7NFX2_STRHE|nr:SUPPRESSOR OF AUXIN RESISTANCE1 [Striga hermonthica]
MAMGTNSEWRMAGMEVPLLSIDSVEWRQLSVPSSSLASSANTSNESVAKDYASCCVIGDPPSYFIWKISASQTNVLEILELCSHKKIFGTGLRLIFADALHPFAFICKDESKVASGNNLMLYTLTVSGVAYLIHLRNNFDYGTSSVVPIDEILECNTQVSPQCGAITAVNATSGCLLIGRHDGSIGCLQMGILDCSHPGFAFDLRDDPGFSRLWGMLSRSPNLAAVQDLVISEVHQRKLLFVLHSDGNFRVWDLLGRCKIFGHAITIETLAGKYSNRAFFRVWVGEASNDTGIIPIAMLHKQNSEVGTETIFLYDLHCHAGDRIVLSLEPSQKKIFIGEGGCIDVKFTLSNVWILKEEVLIMKDLFGNNTMEESTNYYTLQESFIADTLFQSSEHSSDDLLCLAYSVFSASKGEVAPFVSSVFLRALLTPGVHCNAVLRRTLGEYNKHFTESEFSSLTLDGLKSEVLSLIEHQGGSILQRWKSFCSRYVDNWCKYNTVCGLLVDPLTSAIGLVRNNTISLCRGMEEVEHIIYGSFEEQHRYMSPGLLYSGDELSRKILYELLQCLESVSKQLGKASSAIFYESLLNTPHISSDEVVSRFLKILESAYSYTTEAKLSSELGLDTNWRKELSSNRNLRKFSTNMFLSFQEMCNKANSWGKILDVIESYLKVLVPQKVVLKSNAEAIFHINGYGIVQSTFQIAKVMFESVLGVLMLLSYMTSISGQINMSHSDVSRVKLELIPMIQETLIEWHIIRFFGTTPSESPAIEDFSYRLSSLHIDSNGDKRLWSERLGKSDFSLAHILLLSMQSSSDMENLSLSRLPNPSSLINLSREFTSWIIWGRSGEESSAFFSNFVDLAIALLRHGQYNGAEYLLMLVVAYSHKEKTFESLHAVDGKFSLLLHLLGCCLVAQTQHGLSKTTKGSKVAEALRCFFRTASSEVSLKALQNLPHEAGWLRIDFSSSPSSAAWKLHYYQWVMQLFEQYGLSEAACQCALAALEQVDEALDTIGSSSSEGLGESVTTVKGRLWANVFKFTLDLNNYHDAYCAIISNPDEESKTICLRRFIIVLFERGAVKIICDGQLPLIGLVEKVEQELVWKAERSDISTKPNPFKLLYAFEMHRHNWRRAATYMYLYSFRLRADAAVKDHQPRSSNLPERLNGLSAAINALQLVHPSYAWIEVPVDETSLDKRQHPNKRARMTIQEQSPPDDSLAQNLTSYLDVEKLEKEFVLTSAEYMLSLANIKWSFTGNYEKPPANLIDLLVESNSYDMAFTVILKFWKGSALKRELERVFITMALKCCPGKVGPSLQGNDSKMHGLLLTSSQEFSYDSLDVAATSQLVGSGHWETLELYLDKYRSFHPRLPLLVAGTLLSADSQIELPLWLVRHFKGDRSENSFGMCGNESNPASLFRLYVDYGRYTEAINLLIEHTESLASVRPADVIRRKRPFAVWFPYTSIERLWCLLGESIKLGHRVDQSEKLKKLLHGVFLRHLNLLKVDSDDVQSGKLVFQ